MNLFPLIVSYLLENSAHENNDFLKTSDLFVIMEIEVEDTHVPYALIISTTTSQMTVITTPKMALLKPASKSPRSPFEPR